MSISFLLDVPCKGAWFFMHTMRGNIENKMTLFTVHDYIYIYIYIFDLV